MGSQKNQFVAEDGLKLQRSRVSCSVCKDTTVESNNSGIYQEILTQIVHLP